jgi:hypothetical protein
METRSYFFIVLPDNSKYQSGFTFSLISHHRVEAVVAVVAVSE